MYNNSDSDSVWVCVCLAREAWVCLWKHQRATTGSILISMHRREVPASSQLSSAQLRLSELELTLGDNCNWEGAGLLCCLGVSVRSLPPLCLSAALRAPSSEPPRGGASSPDD